MPKSGSKNRPQRPQVACVYLGTERKAELAARALELGYRSVSDYLCALIDYGLSAPKSALEKSRKNPPKRDSRAASSGNMARILSVF